MALTSQPHLSQHVLHHRHCHVTFSVFLPSLSLSLCLCPFFIASSHYALLCLALFNFHISLSLSLSLCSVFPPLQQKQQYQQWLSDLQYGEPFMNQWFKPFFILLFKTLFLFLCSSSSSSNIPNPLIIHNNKLFLWVAFTPKPLIFTPLKTLLLLYQTQRNPIQVTKYPFHFSSTYCFSLSGVFPLFVFSLLAYDYLSMFIIYATTMMHFFVCF
jgi:hypothetical protein